MLTVTEVAQRYHVSRETVLSWVAAGRLLGLDVAPEGSARRHWRFSEDALAAFERQRLAKRTGLPAPTEKTGKIREYVT